MDKIYSGSTRKSIINIPIDTRTIYYMSEYIDLAKIIILKLAKIIIERRLNNKDYRTHANVYDILNNCYIKYIIFNKEVESIYGHHYYYDVIIIFLINKETGDQYIFKIMIGMYDIKYAFKKIESGEENLPYLYQYVMRLNELNLNIKKLYLTLTEQPKIINKKIIQSVVICNTLLRSKCHRAYEYTEDIMSCY